MPANAPSPTPLTTRLGEELPLFCEKCGYNLNGLSQIICGHCSIRHFHCPECGHHQPINTLRPAFQHLLGRLRAAWLILLMLWKIAFFGAAMVVFGVLGGEWLYRYDYRQAMVAGGAALNQSVIRIREVDFESLVIFAIFAFCYGVIGRMMLLRWRRGVIVGFVLGILAGLAMIVGAELNRRGLGYYGAEYPSPYTSSLITMLVNVLFWTMIAAGLVWPIWVGLVKAFLPARIGESLLAWQRAQSYRVTELARGPNS